MGAETGGATAGVTSSEKLGRCYGSTQLNAGASGGTDVGAASVVEIAVGTLCSGGPTNSVSAQSITHSTGCSSTSATGNDYLSTTVQAGVNIGGVHYCSCYTAPSSSSSSSSTIFAIGFSLLAILASLWK